MDFLLVTIGSHGDVHPYVGLGIRLMQRGHRVRLMTSGHFEPLARAAGLDFIPLGTSEEYTTLARDPNLWNPRRAFFVIAGWVTQTLERVYGLIEDNVTDGTIVASSSLCLAARVAEDKLGFPHATIHLSPGVLRSDYEPPKLPGMVMPRWLPRWWKRAMWNLVDRAFVDPTVAPAVNSLRAKLGLAPVKNVMRDWWHAPRLTVGMFPEWFAPPQPDWPPQLRMTGFPLYDERGLATLDDRLPEFLSNGAKPVAFTPGSAMFRGERFFAAAVDACGRAGVRGILLTRHREHVPSSLPKDVIHVDYAPFSELLPRVAALVHHGGIGTSAQAMAAGVPQLVTSMCHDQLDNAARTKRLGVAGTMPVSRFTGRSGARAIKRLLDSEEVRTNCRAVAERFSEADGLGETCDLLVSLSPSITPRETSLVAPRLVER